MRLFLITYWFLGLIACTVKNESNATLDKLKIRRSIKDSLRVVIKDSVLNGSRVGGLEYRRVFWIIKTSDNEELKELARSNNAFLKAIGLKGLFAKRHKEWFEIFQTMASDTGQYIYYQEGCIGYTYNLPEYFLKEVLHYEYMDGILAADQIKKTNDLIDRYKLKVTKKVGQKNDNLWE